MSWNKTKVESVKLEKAFDFDEDFEEKGDVLGREGYNFKAWVKLTY